MLGYAWAGVTGRTSVSEIPLEEERALGVQGFSGNRSFREINPQKVSLFYQLATSTGTVIVGVGAERIVNTDDKCGDVEKEGSIHKSSFLSQHLIKLLHWAGQDIGTHSSRWFVWKERVARIGNPGKSSMLICCCTQFPFVAKNHVGVVTVNQSRIYGNILGGRFSNIGYVERKS